MHDAYFPTVFERNRHQMRALMIDNQPWFVALDFARLLGQRPALLCRRLDPDQTQAVWLEYATGTREEVQVIDLSGAYRALYRFSHPEHQNISRWLRQEVIPTLQDLHQPANDSPTRLLMTWADRRIGALKWQGEVWLPIRALPGFLAENHDGSLSNLPSWRRLAQLRE